jgi:prophage DNA circulation protein
MTWEQSLLPAKFGGIEFDIIKTDDTADRALVEHAYPFVDGANVEDMGRGARKISVEAIFYGDDYETRLNDFLKGLDGYNANYPDPKDHPFQYLQHPIFGEVQVAVARYAVHHEADNVDQASVTVDFVESTPGNPFFDARTTASNAQAVADTAAAVKTAAVEKCSWLAEFRKLNPLSALAKLRAAIMGPFNTLMDYVGNVQDIVGDVMAEAKSWGDAVSNMTTALLDLRDWSRGLEGQWLTIRNNLSSFEIFIKPSSDAPEPITVNMLATEAQAVAVAQLVVDVMVTATMAEAAGIIFAAEAQAFVDATLSPDKIEEIANAARAAIEKTISHARAVFSPAQSRDITEPLKELAIAVQEAARLVIEARPPLVQRTITAPGNLRLTAHILYGDHNRAAELVRLNGARSPFVELGEVVYAYAK